MKNFSLRKATALLLLLTAAGHVSAHATELRIPYTPRSLQQTTIHGTVTDSRGPLPGVTLTVKGKPTTTITDANGQFTIAADLNDILVISYIGYKTTELTVTAFTPLHITLEEDATALQEVTVNAGYYSVKEKESTGSIARITAKDIEKQPVTNVLATMQGRMAGVSVTQDTGTPGGGFNIQIRGLNSLRADGNAPLYIIDGVPYASESTGFDQTSTILPGATSPLNSINPSDIESLEVLKDADATAIYGSRGANGVVLITTKRGKAGKTKFSVNASKGYASLTRKMDLMNTQQYIAMRQQAYANDGFTEIPADAYDINGTWDPNRYTDWQEKLFGGTAQINTLQASVSGGSDATQFLVSANYRDESTVFPGDYRYKKGGAHVNLNHRSSDDKFRLVFSGSYVAQDNDQAASDLTREAILLAPNAPALYDENGNLNWENSTWQNPLRLLEGQFLAQTNDLVANTTMRYELPFGFEAKASVGYTDVRNVESRTTPSTIYDPAYNLSPNYSSLYLNNTSRHSWIAEPQLTWKKAFNDLTVDVLAGGSFQQQTTDRLLQSGAGFSSNSLIHNLAAASRKTVYLDETAVYKYQAFFARANMGYKDRYFLNLTGRRDGSSRFGPGRQFATFGAVGFAWLFSNEELLKENGVLSFGKLRASYGTTGSDQIGDYQFLDTYSTTGVSYQGVIGLQPTRLFNPEFGWETNKKLEVALELGFLNDRLNLSASYYRNRSSNQLVGLPLPGTTGFTSIQSNLDATVQNTGLELLLRSVNVKGDHFSWSTSFNVTVPRNKLVSFPGLADSPYANQYVVGQPIGIVKLFHLEGVNPQTGIYTFEDVNGDGAITYGDDNQTVKDLGPRYFGGIQNQISYKGLSLDFLFHFVKQLNYNENATLAMPGTMTNQGTAMTQAWQQPGDIAPYQMYTTGLNDAAVTAYYNYTSSDAVIGDASFVRLKNVQLAYDLPTKWTYGLQAKLYVQGQNLLTFTQYKGADPEFRVAGYLPPLKVFTAGMQFNF